MGKAGEEVGVAVGQTIAVFQRVGVGGEEFKPALNAGVVFANLGNVLERFVVGVDAEIGGAEVATETFDGSNDGPSFKVEGVQERSMSRVARLMKMMGWREPSGCSCSSVAPKPSRLASQHKRTGREMSATASQSG